MPETFFFVPKGPFYLNELSDELSNQKSKLKISDIKTLDKAKKNHITFFNSLDYCFFVYVKKKNKIYFLL